ncbi:MAG: SGNH/GDSL hydrolase family protein [Leeuwenhoekiella sp.]|nr:SGNH/GDSL hydrolase family protein [Leeuwenhoekiella sp.]
MNIFLFKYAYLVLIIIIATSCSASAELEKETSTSFEQSYSYLALGDSYTIGESVCDNCKFPIQLKNRFETTASSGLETTIIARTGWRTDNLITALASENLNPNFDLVTLLIGVNNQYQGIVFSEYQKDFKTLLETAIQLAQGDAARVVVISIPDYAYTPFGLNYRNPEDISSEIDEYNTYAKELSEANGVVFLNITDITRKGLSQPNLVASDGLHPSKDAYALFVDRLVLLVENILNK